MALADDHSNDMVSNLGGSQHGRRVGGVSHNMSGDLAVGHHMSDVWAVVHGCVKELRWHAPACVTVLW